jgi:hypothetical protein
MGGNTAVAAQAQCCGTILAHPFPCAVPFSWRGVSYCIRGTSEVDLCYALFESFSPHPRPRFHAQFEKTHPLDTTLSVKCRSEVPFCIFSLSLTLDFALLPYPGSSFDGIKLEIHVIFSKKVTSVGAFHILSCYFSRPGVVCVFSRRASFNKVTNFCVVYDIIVFGKSSYDQ